jgi:formate hydrogenlyase subunit 3/multisubunit Na+/H+ antiporter MnhD subunit
VFKSDLLSSFFVLVISLITAIISIYAIGYLEPYQNKGKKLSSHCFFLPILTATMLLVVTCQNALMFLILWELMSLSSFFLVIFEDDKKEVISAGIKYLIYMHISVVFIIAAFIVMSNYSGDYDFNSFKYIFMHYPYLKNIVFLLAFIGFGTKAGFFPMHNWLPDAHPAAPSHVSAVMSAVMIKTGIYGILRILQLIGTPTKIMGYTILFISVITALYGIIYAVNQKDIKKLLAYSSVENIGIIGIAISTIIFGQIYVNNLVIMLGVAGCFLHILNHSIFKSLLFMGVGSVYLKTHTKNIELLGGLIKKMPFTALFFLFGSIAICAFPPLNGFISEFLIYIGLLNMLKLNSSTLFIPVILTIGVLALVGTLVILAMSKLYSIIFLGKARSEHIDKVDYDVPQTMLIPMGILSGLTIVIGISSAFIVNIIPFSAFEIPVLVRYEYLYIFLQLTIISLIVLVFCLFIVISLYLRFMFLKKSQTYQTWSCGYNKGNNHIQYTASSFVSPFTSILTPLFKKIFDVKKPKGLFPKDAHYTSTVEDVEEAYIINPLLKFDEKLLTKFERLQDGNIQHYILYGLIFLILILIGVVIIG